MYEPMKDETKRQYLRIWTHYAVGHLNQQQLAELFGCSEDTISNAIKWCAENRAQHPTPILAEAAKEAIETRLRELKNDLIRIKEVSSVNWNAVIGINKLIKENEELLWKLQAVIINKSIINTTQINQVVKARDEVVERLNDDQRKHITSRIREVLNQQPDEQERP